MNDKQKYEVAYRLAVGTGSGLMFLEDYLNQNPQTDITVLRSLYILLSYYAELLLKSRIVMMGTFSNKEEIKKCLTMFSHDLEKMKIHLGDIELAKIGIIDITKTGDQYSLKTTKGTDVYIEDFTNIRYDYIFGKQRIVPRDEYKNILENVNTLFDIYSRVKDVNLEESKNE